MRLRLISLLLLLTFMVLPVEAKKRPRRYKGRLVKVAAPEPILTPCQLARRSNPRLGQEISRETEEKIKLGIEPRRPANVDPCP